MMARIARVVAQRWFLDNTDVSWLAQKWIRPKFNLYILALYVGHPMHVG